tara:strand:+ start:94 stop:756 length:663 start_codon:yes stop_codon:yes gene_type:complete
LHGLVTTGKRTWVDNGWIDLVHDAGREALVIDLPGHGTEFNPTSNFNGNFLDFVHERLPLGEVDVVGFSLGANLLLKLATTSPSKFRKIVVAGVGDSLFTPDESRGKKISRAISGNGNLEDPETRYFAQLADHPDINGELIAESLRNLNLHLSPDDLSKLNLPVLVVLGDKDFASPATKLINSLSEGNLVMLKGVDHFATPKDFTFLESALDFLDANPSW